MNDHHSDQRVTNTDNEARAIPGSIPEDDAPSQSDELATSSDLEITITHDDITAIDEYVTDDYGKTIQFIEDCIAMGFHGECNPHRVRRHIDFSNPATRMLTAKAPSMEAWLRQIPTAAALQPLYRPTMPFLTTGEDIDTNTRTLFCNTTDATGIRLRATLLQKIVRTESQRQPVRDRSTPLSVISLACGVAEPMVNALSRIAHETGRTPELTAVDYDRSALAETEKIASKYGLDEHVRTFRDNILHPARAVSEKLGKELSGSADIVDIVGIMEYLDVNDSYYEYKGVVSGRPKQAGAVSLVRNSFDLVRPGGLLIVGNMSTEHPHLGFTLNTIQWPHIIPRTTDEVLSIFNAAGLTGALEVIVPSDKIYNLYALRKPFAT